MNATQYRPPLLLKNGHLHTVYANSARLFQRPGYARERIATPDEDFLDLDWLRSSNSTRLFILSHGLEGSSQAGYIKSFARTLLKSHADVLAWNFRGCSGEPNRRLSSYHSGKSEDLRVVVAHALQKDYEAIYLIGISAGGNMTLKYLGEEGSSLSNRVKGAAGISTPCDLEGCAAALAERENYIYMKRFLLGLYQKLKIKKEVYPELDLTAYHEMKNFYDYDNRYTAPQNGYENCFTYWEANSSLKFIEDIQCPTLLLSAYDDPFLSESCYPEPANSNIKCIYTKYGGHVGYLDDYLARSSWYENQILNFFVLTAEAQNNAEHRS